MHEAKGALKPLNWVWGMLVAALIVVGVSSPVAARHFPAAATSAHQAWLPVNGHHFDLSAKPHRHMRHVVRRSLPDPMLASSDAGLPGPSRLEPVAAPAHSALSRAVAAQLPPQTGPPTV